MAPPQRPAVQLVGRFVEYGEPGTMGEVTSARRTELPRGRVTLVVEHESTEDAWSLRLSSTDGRSFRGTLSRPEASTEHAVSMMLWRAPDDETKWLLLGTWTDEDDAEMAWSIELSAAAGG